MLIPDNYFRPKVIDLDNIRQAIMEIISRSWLQKVIQPDSLREPVCAIYRTAIERNKTKNC
ncbi:MAG: hypothetical protein LBT24_01060 [Tannerella sp.]|jgi:hypothetical protein|nr:hypothetical protein [Tannerella sp.]